MSEHLVTVERLTFKSGKVTCVGLSVSNKN